MPTDIRYLLEAPYTEIKWITLVNRRHGVRIEDSDITETIRYRVLVPEEKETAWADDISSRGGGRIRLTRSEQSATE